jgi:hypothetical protein
VKGVEGDDEIEFILKAQAARVANCEAKIRMVRRTKAVRGEGDHLLGWVDAERGAAGKTLGDFGSDPSIAATNVEDALAADEREAGELLRGHGLL